MLKLNLETASETAAQPNAGDLDTSASTMTDDEWKVKSKEVVTAIRNKANRLGFHKLKIIPTKDGNSIAFILSVVDKTPVQIMALNKGIMAIDKYMDFSNHQINKDGDVGFGYFRTT